MAVVGHQADQKPHVYLSFLVSSAEHSYGSSSVSSKDINESEFSLLEFFAVSHHNYTTRDKRM